MTRTEIFPLNSWNAIKENEYPHALDALEQGKVLYFPHLSFPLYEEEKYLLTPAILAPSVKNISYDARRRHLKGMACSPEKAQQLQQLMERFYLHTMKLVKALFIPYQGYAHFARTSFRPAEIEGRVTSYKKDDTRLHVDAFPATPNQGTRILRVFSNINPAGKPRTWRLGEPFQKVAEKFVPLIPSPLPGSRWALHRLGITKTYRTLYDHYMLQIHDRMKADLIYQQQADQETKDFPAGSTWMVMTDHVSHAAMSGQHLLEQTIHLPVTAMQNPTLSPLHVLQKLLNRSLIK